MASSMSTHDVFVFGFISCQRCSCTQRSRSFEAFVMQNFVAAGSCHGKTFTCPISDGSIESCRYCYEKIQRSKARIIEAAGLQPRTNQPFVQRLERADPAPRLFRCHGRSDASDGFQRRVFVHMAAWVGWLHLFGHSPGQPLRSFDFVTAETASNCSHGDDPYDISSEAAETSSDCPAWSQEGMIQWLYDRCERRLEKAVVNQNPLKTSQYLARQGILSNMLAWPSSKQPQPRLENKFNKSWRTSLTYPAVKIHLQSTQVDTRLP